MTIKIIIIQVFKCFHSNNLIINPGHGCSYDNFNITLSVYYFQKRKIHLSINFKILNINNKYRSEKRWAYMRYLFTILFKIFLHSVNCLLDLRVFPIAFTVAKYKPCEIKYTKRKKTKFYNRYLPAILLQKTGIFSPIRWNKQIEIACKLVNNKLSVMFSVVSNSMRMKSHLLWNLYIDSNWQWNY